MHERQTMGVVLALDDFGAGCSYLTYLQALPTQTLKIHQSLIRDKLHHKQALAIVPGIIRLSATLDREVIAEGVETVEQGLA